MKVSDKKFHLLLQQHTLPNFLLLLTIWEMFKWLVHYVQCSLVAFLTKKYINKQLWLMLKCHNHVNTSKISITNILCLCPKRLLHEQFCMRNLLYYVIYM